MVVGLAVLASMLRTGAPSSLCCASVDWKAFLKKRPSKFFSFLDEVEVETKQVELSKDTLSLVHSVAQEVIGELEIDEPLTSAGMDSLSAVELRRQLAKNGPLPATVAFDYPSVRALAAYLDQQEMPEATPAVVTKQQVVQGKGWRMPGILGWEAFAEQLDAVTEIPLQRFDVNECFDANGLGFFTYARPAPSIMMLLDYYDIGLFLDTSFSEWSRFQALEMVNGFEAAYRPFPPAF